EEAGDRGADDAARAIEEPPQPRVLFPRRDLLELAAAEPHAVAGGAFVDLDAVQLDGGQTLAAARAAVARELTHLFLAGRALGLAQALDRRLVLIGEEAMLVPLALVVELLGQVVLLIAHGLSR